MSTTTTIAPKEHHKDDVRGDDARCVAVSLNEVMTVDGIEPAPASRLADHHHHEDDGHHHGAPSATIRKRWLILGTTLLMIVAAILVVVVMVGGGSIAKRSGQAAGEKSVAAPATSNSTGTVKFLMEQQWLIRMRLAEAEQQTVARQITSTGRVTPAVGHHAVVAPPVGGLIAGGALPRTGQRVTQGQVLVVLRQTPTAAEAAQIQASNVQLRVEHARLEAERRRLTQVANEARARMLLEIIEVEHAQRLFDKKAYSLNQYQMAQHNLKKAETDYDAAVQQISAFDVKDFPAAGPAAAGGTTGLGAAVTPVSHEVRAPIGGTVVKVHKAMGEQVAPGEAILEIVDLKTVWVEAPIFERDLHRVNNQPVSARFTTTAYPAAEFKGTIKDIGAVIDEQTRAATVIFELPNADRRLRIGMQANVRLDAGEMVEALMIPTDAVIDNEGKKIVYVLLSGEEFERREVTLGEEYGNRVAILSGLRPGERVVTQGAYQLRLHELKPAAAGEHSHET